MKIITETLRNPSPAVDLKIVHVIYSFGIGGLEKGITTLINHGSPDVEHIIISLCGNRDSEKLLQRPAWIFSLDKQHGNSMGFILKIVNFQNQEPKQWVKGLVFSFMGRDDVQSLV